VNALRTPDERFAGLPDFPFAPQFREWDGLRLAHLDEGEGAPVIFVHGEPTWSFLWRKVIPPVLEWYSYDRHVAAVAALLEDLDLRGATVVVHDWGGPIGLRLAVEHPDRIERMVILDTGLFTGRQKMTEAWIRFHDFVERTEDVPVGMLVRGACHTDPGDEVIAAYDAPFPSAEHKAGARAFPLILPTRPDAPGAEAGQRVQAALGEDERPKLVLWADSDPILTLETGRRFAAALGTEVHHVIPDASHFLQEDEGARIGGLIADWL